MPRKFLRKHLPDVATVRSYRLVSMFGTWLHHPNLWCLNRRSVPGAVAIGLFCGLIPGPLQMLGALLGAMPLEPFLWDWANIGGSLREFAHWTVALGKPLAIGLVALAATLA